MLIRILRIMRCCCCLWVSCNIMQYWIFGLSLLFWKCWWWCSLCFDNQHFYFLYSKLKSCSFLMFSSVWTVTSASPFTLRTEIFSCRKVFERLFVITYKFWLKLRPKQNLHNFIWFLQPSIFDLCQYPNSLLKISPITLTRLRSYPKSFWNTLP